MNIAFLKLRVADDAWLVMDRGPDRDGEPDWASVARSACHRSRGASASGIVVVTRGESRHQARAWDRTGESRALGPAAALCAARWLFDAGRSRADLIAIDGEGGETEVLVLDSRNFGLALGEATLPSGGALGTGTAAARLLKRPKGPADGMGSMTVALRGELLRVRIFDGLPEGRPSDRRPAVTAACISRSLLSVRRGRADALLAAAASCAVAAALDCAEPELSVTAGGETILVQRPDGPGLFVAAEASYCLSGELWIPEAGDQAK